MKLQSASANAIDAYLNGRQKEDNMAVRVEVDGKIATLDVYRVPIRLLRYNIRNGRFASELLQMEAKLKRKLDSANAADAKIIRSLLLEQSESETALLKKDLIQHEQVEPGIITRDGAVINANRRMSIISSLFEETHEPKWEYLKVGILPDTVSEKDLWRIEAGLQFGKDFRLEYGPINELLKIREGVTCGLQPEDIAATLLGRFSAKDVQERLRRLELIDSYLIEIDKPGDYTQVGRSMEKFNSLSTNVINQLNKKSDLDPVDIYKVSRVGFGLIRDGEATHWDIRKLSNIARSDKAKKALLEELPEDPYEAGKEELNDAFTNAIDVISAEKEHEKPERLLQKALTAIQSIDPAGRLLSSSKAQKSLAALITACNALVRSDDGAAADS